MPFQWMRHALLGLASTALLLLGACGSGTIESQLSPSRVIAFGDAFIDAGQNGFKYTVNDGSLNWAQIVAGNYGHTLTPSATGGLDYATGNARIVASPDAAGGAAPTIQQQIDTFLASNSLGPNDLVIIGGGYSDFIAEMAAVNAGAETSDQMLSNLQQAGRDLAAQAKRLVAAGATHVVVTGVYDLGRSPWAAMIGQPTLLSTASSTGRSAFNNALLVALVDQGANMLYVDTALLFNEMLNNPSGFTLTDVSNIMCTSVDPGPGIGIGASQVNSNLCTSSTVRTDISYHTALFADAVYPTPQGQARFGDYAFSKIHSRW